MLENKNQNQRDYKERFEFRLTMKNLEGGENIICQRYFRIQSFNPMCVNSYELVDTIRKCAQEIDRDLKSKTHVYLETFAPRYFDTIEEMENYFKNPKNRAGMRYGEGIVVRDYPEHDFFWTENGPKEADYKFDDGELCNPIPDNAIVEYKLAFCDNGEEVCSTVWDGVYPKYVRNSIDLSNKKGKFDGEDVTWLSFGQYLLYRMSKGRKDIMLFIIQSLCEVCSLKGKEYTTSDEYTTPDGKVVTYNNRKFYR